MSEEATLDEFSEVESSENQVETLIGELPVDWAVERLTDVTNINPDRFSEDDWPSNTFEYITLSEVSEGEIQESKTVPIGEAPGRAQRQINWGDVLVGTVRPKQVSHGFVTPEHDEKICSDGFGVLRANTNVNSRYLIQEILSHRFYSQMDAYVSGSGYPAITISDLKKHQIAVPPLPEQRKIATVLYTVDWVIKKTEEIIDREYRIKKGFKRNIFSEGYFNHQSYQESKVGKIPRSWKVESAADLCDGITVGVVTGATDSYVLPSEGIPFIRSKDIHENHIDQDSLKYISKEFHEQQNNSELHEGDVITVRTGNPGTSCVIPPELDGANCFSLIISRPKNDMNEYYYSYYINSEKALNFIDSWKAGGVQDNFNIGVMERLPIPVPSEEEQQAIVGALDDMNKRIESELQYRNHLQRLKRGLLQDLLSGTVRTADTNIEVPDEITQHG